ncbi:MAG: gamma-glutamyltranspeptidase/glutathione hydrolase [Lysobacterales bacterium]
MTDRSGIAASGHIETSKAAARILAEGGNAFDAALAALCVACVAEPMLASFGGGGFLLARPASGPAQLYDFFVHTPKTKRPCSELDFYPIIADFGTATQEFHVGMGSMAVPGVVAGLFGIQRLVCRLPMSEIMAPAIELARTGVRITRFQNYISHILAPILEVSPEAMQLVATRDTPTTIAQSDELVQHPDFADLMESLLLEGPDLFYRGELARKLSGDCDRLGGQLSMQDLADYRMLRREPIRFSSHGADFLFNAPPSPSGCLVAFALGLLEDRNIKAHHWGRDFHCLSMAQAMQAAGSLRKEYQLDINLRKSQVEEILEPGHLDQWRDSINHQTGFSRGTTHMSVADSEGNMASLTLSNGEGCAYVLPGTGIMMNNMLGEEDLSPGGFHHWKENRRMSSMMCPSIVTLQDGSSVALGSGGSNRIRSAILQVLVNLCEFDMSLEEAVNAPRFHIEGDYLSIEHGFHQNSLESLLEQWPEHKIWPQANMFFGGVHAVGRSVDGDFIGAGDPRRGGAVALSGHN